MTSVQAGSPVTTAASPSALTWKGMLEKQKEKYGKELFEKDTAGNHVCFFRDCRKAFLQNFSRHIQKHELLKDPLDEAHIKSVLGIKASKALFTAYRTWTSSSSSCSSSAAVTPSPSLLVTPSPTTSTPASSPFSSFVITRPTGVTVPNQHVVSSTPSVQNKTPAYVIANIALGKRYRGCLTILKKLRRSQHAQRLLSHQQVSHRPLGSDNNQINSQDVFSVMENKLHAHEIKSYREFKEEVDSLFRRLLTSHPSEELKVLVREFEQIFHHKLRKYEACVENPETFSDECAKCHEGGTLLCCEGTCMRAFHMGCVGLQQNPPTNSTWLCPECLNGVYVLHHDTEKGTYFYFTYNINPSNDPFRHLGGHQPLNTSQTTWATPKRHSSDVTPVELICDLGSLTKEQKVMLRRDDEEKRDSEMVYDPYFACWVPKSKQIAEQRVKRQRRLIDSFNTT